MPDISVLLPVHNGMHFLEEALLSILTQSHADFECLLINDASTDESMAIAEAISDTRLKIVNNQSQIGLAASLNRGLEMSESEFIARMDADDIAHPERFLKQIEYLRDHPGVDICGTWARTFGSGKAQEWRYTEADADIKAELLFASVLVHSSVMMRRASLKAANLVYDEKLGAAQDFDLWTRAIDHMTFANVPEFLLQYRLHEHQLGQTSNADQQLVADKSRERLLKKLDIQSIQLELDRHHQISRWQFGNHFEDLKEIEAWLMKLNSANEESGVFESASLCRAIEKRWWAACRKFAITGLPAWQTYHDSDISSWATRSLREKSTFFAKSALASVGKRP